MVFSGTSYHEVKEFLNVSHIFIREWKNQALFHSVKSLRLQFFIKMTIIFLQMVKYLMFLNFFSMEFCHNHPEDCYGPINEGEI